MVRIMSAAIVAALFTGAAATAQDPPVTRPVLPALDADATPEGERFSNHARRLLEIMSAEFELSGKPAHAAKTAEETADDARFIASLTQSKNKELRRAAVWTCLLYVVHMGQNADSELIRKVAQWSLPSESIELKQEFQQLLKDGKGGILDETLGEFGQALGAIVFTREFREHRLQHLRFYASGAFSALARREMVRLADAADVGQAPRYVPIRVTLEHVPSDRIYLRITNQSRRPLRHVMISTRGVADGAYVRRAANGYRLQARVVNEFGFFPDMAADELPKMVDIWEATQMLDVGAILYLPEMPPSANIKVELCSIDRLKMTEDVRVSIWSDELVAKDVPAWNLKKVLNEVRPAAERIDKAALEANQKKTEAIQAGLAQLALNLAKDAIARGDEARTRAFLQQAIKNAPDSPAGKEAQELLKKYQP
jgi:hypothetical protein